MLLFIPLTFSLPATLWMGGIFYSVGIVWTPARTSSVLTQLLRALLSLTAKVPTLRKLFVRRMFGPLTHADGGEQGGLAEGAWRHGD